jgi:hypothetical protein
MLSSSLVLALLAWSGTLEVWHVALASFVNGIAWTTDNPVRRTMIGEVVGPDRMSAAMSLDVGANNASRMLGPTVGGVLLATIGIGGAFAVSVACYLVAVAAAVRIHHRNTARLSGAGSVVARMIEGFLLVRHDRRLIGTLVITVIYNTFGWPFTSMIPVIGQDNLHLGAVGIGLLASMDGVGAFCGAMLIALWAKPATFARFYVGGVFVCLLMLPVFCIGAGCAVRRHGAADHGARECRVQHHAGNARLPCRTARDAQPHLRRAVGLHRHRFDRVYSTRRARRPDRRGLGDGDERRRGNCGNAVDKTLVARDRGVIAQAGLRGNRR